ncbi:agamous-like MADS-box protein AGL80 [Solanum lycopersicum]|uniref:agamous-like MADS-box protein AGL80 n=1 Tax=Solanum lycopersicum TaxID=4081 RepID=UPI000532EC77|nr:agamous-like MADS-box protein AGL80 [Solanum lycopersicum]
MAVTVYSPYSDEPKVFPNLVEAINTFQKFKELETLEISKSMVTKEEFAKKRIKKLQKKLLKIRKENRIKEITNEMHEVLNGKIISIDMNIFYINDLSYVIKKNLLLIRKIMKKNDGDEGSTSNVPQSTPSITRTSMMSSPIIDPPFTAMTPQMDPLDEIPSIGASIQMNNNQNSTDIPQSPSIIDLLNMNDDDFVTLLDDLSLNNANDQDSNPSNNK